VQNKESMRIVYCLNSIRYLGGIQHVTIVKANALAEIEGNEVYIIVTDNKDGVLCQPLSPKVRLVDLDVNYYSDDWKSRWNVLTGIFVKRREHKRRLAKALNEIQPDIVISVGQAEKNMLPSIHGDWKTIRELHFMKNYRMMSASTLMDKVMAVCGDLYDYHYKIFKYDRIVVLTNEDKDVNWNGNYRMTVIPNPTTFSGGGVSSLSVKTVIATGRLARQKNFSSLIRAFKLVATKHPDWHLEIYGEGGEKTELQSLINTLGLAGNVFLKGYTSNVQRKMLDASCFVLSSLYEGLPLVMVEAMSCGLPVVSYACPCGPKDIISEGVDGFLVPVGDEAALADRICRLIEDKDLRLRMGRAAKEKANKYRLENVIPMWMDLFNRLLEQKP